MSTTINFDSATATEVYDLTLAFQRTSKSRTLPAQIGTEPTIRVAGIAFGWTSPKVTSEHASAILREFHRNQDER